MSSSIVIGARPGTGPAPGRRLKIVGLGDSTTAGTPGFLSPLEAPPDGKGDVQSQYAYWVHKAHPDWDVLNRGINGERSDQILARFARDVVREEPSFVVVLAGVNDIYQGFPIEFTERNLTEMYSRTAKLGATAVACSVLPYNVMTAEAAKKRRNLNEWISAKSQELSIPFCDTSAAAADPKDAEKLVSSPDGLHPGPSGYRRMADFISETIEGQMRPKR